MATTLTTVVLTGVLTGSALAAPKWIDETPQDTKRIIVVGSAEDKTGALLSALVRFAQAAGTQHKESLLVPADKGMVATGSSTTTDVDADHLRVYAFEKSFSMKSADAQAGTGSKSYSVTYEEGEKFLRLDMTVDWATGGEQGETRRRTEGTVEASGRNCGIHDVLDYLEAEGVSVEGFAAPRGYHIKLDVAKDSPFVKRVSNRSTKN
jgi:hypothetical protein